jgi:Zn-dependent peptidase ImmA (M78 family)
MTKKQIEEKARSVLKDHGLYSIPVDPIVLANRIGISVQNAKFSEDALSGMVAKRRNLVSILVNVNDPPFRKRFTIAHELGHNFLHLLKDGDFVDRDSDLFRDEIPEGVTDIAWINEVQANQFAAALLMDEKFVREFWDKDKNVDRLADKFKVSASAMGIRISSLGLKV